MSISNPTPNIPARSRRALVAAGVLGIILLLGCEDGVIQLDDDDDAAEITVSDRVSTVVTVRWDAPVETADEIYVEYGLDESYGHQAPVTVAGDGEVEAVLLGLKQATEYHLRTVVVQDGQATPGADRTVVTGEAPASLTELSLHAPLPDEMRQGYVLTSLMSIPPAPVIIDSDGDYVWWYVFDEGHPPPMSRLILSQDGGSFILQRPAGDEEFADPDEVVRVSYDGTREEVITGGIEGHHDMVELPDGTIAMFKAQTQQVEGNDEDGDILVEIAPDGEETIVWSVWDTEEFLELDDYVQTWSHANALNYDPGEDVYYLSLRNLNAIYKIDRATGGVLWKLGGEDSDFEAPGVGTDVSTYQHQFQIYGDGILIFDNGDADDYSSRVVEYTLDEAEGIADPVWSYNADPPVYVYGLGDVHRFDDGDTMVTWSTAGRIEFITHDREIIWRLDADLGTGFAYTTWTESLYVTH